MLIKWQKTVMSPTGTSKRRWACETWTKAGNVFNFFSFVLYSPTRASAGSPIRDLQLGREVAFCCIRRSCLATWEFCPAAIPRFAQLHCEKLTQKKNRAAREKKKEPQKHKNTPPKAQKHQKTPQTRVHQMQHTRIDDVELVTKMTQEKQSFQVLSF